MFNKLWKSIVIVLVFGTYIPSCSATLPAQENIASFVRKVIPPLLLVPAALQVTQHITSAQNRYGFTHTMLAGQLATLLALAWREHTKTKYTLPAFIEPHDKLACLHLTGPIQTTEKFHDALKKCLEDTKTKGIIVKIDADRGSLSICQTIFKELQRAREEKPIVVLVEKCCCREPYLIATAADRIIANEHALVGMIGTTVAFIEQRPDPSREIFSFYAGKSTPLGDSNHHLTPADQQLIAELVELQYQHLCETISTQRSLSLEQCATWAEGKPFLGMQALKVGLIDSLGTLSTAYETMRELVEQQENSLSQKFDVIPYYL